MSEIEKMYSNAGVEPKRGKEITIDPTTDKENYHNVYYGYPPFTAEKQLELIKWLAKRPLTLIIGRYKGKYYFGNSYFKSNENNFEEALATRINDLWNILPEEEKQQVKGILE